MPATPSEAITMGIAERKGVDQTDLPPLYEVVEPEALDRVVDNENSCRVSFEYAGYEVTVEGANAVTIDEKVASLPNERA